MATHSIVNLMSGVIYSALSNSQKYTSLKNLLAPLGVDLQQLEYDFDEGRDLDIRKIAEAKLAQAKQVFPGKKLIVDDRGFSFQP